VRHFDKYIRVSGGGGAVSVLRVYDPDRRTGTVNDDVKRYCLTTADSSSFVAPTRRDVVHHKIIVTTLVTSLMLTKLAVRGLFTHIFIDEAAQVGFDYLDTIVYYLTCTGKILLKPAFRTVLYLTR